MTDTSKIKKQRIEIWLTKKESRAIRDHICKPDETRKQAIERIVKDTVIKAIRKVQLLQM